MVAEIERICSSAVAGDYSASAPRRAEGAGAV